MKHPSLASLLLATLLAIPTQTKSMGMDPEHQPLTESLFNNQQASQPVGNCSPKMCGVPGMVFTVSSVVGGAISFPICAALNTSLGFAAIATLVSGITGTLIHRCYFIKTYGLQEN